MLGGLPLLCVVILVEAVRWIFIVNVFGQKELGFCVWSGQLRFRFGFAVTSNYFGF